MEITFSSRRLAVLILSLLAICWTSPTRAADDAYIVKPSGERSTIVIEVAPFEVEGAKVDGRLDPSMDMAAVIANDLALSGFFRPPDHAAFARETHRLDRARGKIQFAEWHRIGVFFLVKSTYTLEGDQLTVKTRIFDTVSRSYVFGRRYLDWNVADARRLAHRISNDIIERLTNEPGIADTQIAFVRNTDRLGRHKQICVMDADGHGARAVTPTGELVATPAWGANGSEIYYTTYRDYNPDLRGHILKTGAEWWVSRRAGMNIMPSWSQTQELIALVMTRDGNSEIYTIRRDGKDLQRLTHNRAIDSAPSWSRDQRDLVFTSDRGGSPQIYVMEVATRKTRRLTYRGSYNDAAAWSPAGPERIAFSSRVGGKFHIFTIKPDGTDLRQLTQGASNNEDPIWAPNGLVLAFSSDRSGRYQVYTMFVDGSNVTRLTHGTEAKSPAWSPATK